MFAQQARCVCDMFPNVWGAPTRRENREVSVSARRDAEGWDAARADA